MDSGNGDTWSQMQKEAVITITDKQYKDVLQSLRTRDIKSSIKGIWSLVTDERTTYNEASINLYGEDKTVEYQDILEAMSSVLTPISWKPNTSLETRMKSPENDRDYLDLAISYLYKDNKAMARKYIEKSKKGHALTHEKQRIIQNIDIVQEIVNESKGAFGTLKSNSGKYVAYESNEDEKSEGKEELKFINIVGLLFNEREIYKRYGAEQDLAEAIVGVLATATRTSDNVVETRMRAPETEEDYLCLAISYLYKDNTAMARKYIEKSKKGHALEHEKQKIIQNIDRVQEIVNESRGDIDKLRAQYKVDTKKRQMETKTEITPKNLYNLWRYEKKIFKTNGAEQDLTEAMSNVLNPSRWIKDSRIDSLDKRLTYPGTYKDFLDLAILYLNEGKKNKAVQYLDRLKKKYPKFISNDIGIIYDNINTVQEIVNASKDVFDEFKRKYQLEGMNVVERRASKRESDTEEATIARNQLRTSVPKSPERDDDFIEISKEDARARLRDEITGGGKKMTSNTPEQKDTPDESPRFKIIPHSDKTLAAIRKKLK